MVFLQEVYYTKPKKRQISEPPSVKDFWLPQKQLTQTVEAASTASFPAIAIKKAGDFPPFWKKDLSLIK